MGMQEQMDYRSLYREHYRIDFNSDFVVHHIDLDHGNNEIGNLILLPIPVHVKYHNILRHLNVNEHGDVPSVLVSPTDRRNLAKYFRTLASSFDEIEPWTNLKKEMDHFIQFDDDTQHGHNWDIDYRSLVGLMPSFIELTVRNGRMCFKHKTLSEKRRCLELRAKQYFLQHFTSKGGF